VCKNFHKYLQNTLSHNRYRTSPVNAKNKRAKFHPDPILTTKPLAFLKMQAYSKNNTFSLLFILLLPCVVYFESSNTTHDETNRKEKED